MRRATKRRDEPSSPAFSNGPSACAQSVSARPSQNCQRECAASAMRGVLRSPVPDALRLREPIGEGLRRIVAGRARDGVRGREARVEEERLAQRRGDGGVGHCVGRVGGGRPGVVTARDHVPFVAVEEPVDQRLRAAAAPRRRPPRRRTSRRSRARARSGSGFGACLDDHRPRVDEHDHRQHRALRRHQRAERERRDRRPPRRAPARRAARATPPRRTARAGALSRSPTTRSSTRSRSPPGSAKSSPE